MTARYVVNNLTRTGRVVERVERAESFWARLKGLLGRDELPAGEGLWIDPCNSIHTMFMRFPIDAIFLDREQRVVRVLANLPPGRMTRVHWAAQSCLELPAGASVAAGIAAGDRLSFELAGHP